MKICEFGPSKPPYTEEVAVRFLFIFASLVGILLVIPGISAASWPPLEGDVTSIEFVDGPQGTTPFSLGPCDGANSTVLFSFKSTGSGTVHIEATDLSNTPIGSIVVEVTTSPTEVMLPIGAGFSGEAIVNIEGAQYAVADGEKGDQTAYNSSPIFDVSNAKCTLAKATQTTTQTPDWSTIDWKMIIWTSLSVIIIVFFVGVIVAIIIAARRS